jgi:cell division protein FtsQ
MKRIIQISLFVIFVVAVSGLMGFIYIEQSKLPLNSLIININRDTEKGFLSEEILREIIPGADTLTGKAVKDIRIRTIEKSISQNPFVRQLDVFINIDKDLIINIEEKIPVLRIYGRKNQGFYIDEKGTIIPLSKNYTARVLIANGYVDIEPVEGHSQVNDTLYKDTPLNELFELTMLIKENPFLNAQISQIYVNSKGEFDLIPELGNHLIHFGTMDEGPLKLENLEIFYKQALLKEGWEKYKTINLKYKNQVVCEKK